MDAITSGVNSIIAEGRKHWKPIAQFAVVAPKLIRGQEPSMVVGRPGAATMTQEDDGCTVVLPLPVDCPKLYACQNETGGATVMLAEEY